MSENETIVACQYYCRCGDTAR